MLKTLFLSSIFTLCLSTTIHACESSSIATENSSVRNTPQQQPEVPQTISTQHTYFQDPTLEKKELAPIIPYQDSCLDIPTDKQEDLSRKIVPREQTYAQAIALGTALGGLNTLGCCLLEQQLPLWWPLNVVAARISCSLLLPSLVYASLAFAERHGITCHSSTMHTSSVITDWTTYLAIKKFY